VIFVISSKLTKAAESQLHATAGENDKLQILLLDILNDKGIFNETES
jgi:hypothetical protein